MKGVATDIGTIHFVGIGEKAEDLRPFSAAAFARALVGLRA